MTKKKSPIHRIKNFVVTGIYTIVEQGLFYPAMLVYDQIRGVDFYKTELKDLYDIYLYECTHMRIDRQVKKLCRRATGKDSLIDVGCGKGRMLEIFSGYAFKRVDGIELDKGLCQIAKRNMRKLGLASGIYNKDARQFGHWERYNYFYFYNPFPQEVMDVCLDHIIQSLSTHPRKITVFYANPVCHQSFLDHGFREVPIKLDLIERIWQPYLSGLKMYRH